MATKTENTAVNRLIEQAHTRTLDADDALFSSPPSRKTLPRPFPGRIDVSADPPAPLPRNRIPASTQTHLAAAPPAPRLADLEDSGLLQVDDDDDMPVTVSEEPIRPIAARPSALGAVPGLDEAAWYEESIGVDRLDEASLGTRVVARPNRARSMLWLSAAFAAGLVATAVVAWPGRSATVPKAAAPAVIARQPAATVVAPAVAPTVVAVEAAPAVVEPAVVEPAVVEPAVVEPAVVEPAIVEPAIVEPAVVEPAVPVPVTVALDSEPRGATVLLVDGSTTVTLGVTPLAHPLEPTRSYELMFTLAGHKSALVSVDPGASARVSVDMKSATVAMEPAVAKAAPRAAPAVAKVVAPRGAKVEPRKAEPKAKPAPKAAPRVTKAEPVKPAAGGKGGVLMLGAKPPCDIFIDGKATGLKTPQRAIKVSPGPHKVTLVNRENRITETFTIDVKAGVPTKIVKDLTKRMK